MVWFALDSSRAISDTDSIVVLVAEYVQQLVARIIWEQSGLIQAASSGTISRPAPNWRVCLTMPLENLQLCNSVLWVCCVCNIQTTCNRVQPRAIACNSVQ